MTEGCVERLASEFLASPHRFHSEDSLHSQLFHYLSQAGLNEEVETVVGHPMGTLQHEYPPIVPDPGKGRRGEYDLVIFDRSTIARANHWGRRMADGTPRGKPLPPLIAVEMGLDKGLAKDSKRVSSRLGEFRKELARLANRSNQVQHGFVTYFYRYATFHQRAMREMMKHIRQEAEAVTKHSRNLVVVVAAAGYDENKKFTVIEKNELRVEGGATKKAEGALFR